jgi:hypothetical protein
MMEVLHNLIRTRHHNLPVVAVVDNLVLVVERTSWLEVRKGLKQEWVLAVRRHWELVWRVWQLAFLTVGSRLLVEAAKMFSNLMAVERLLVLVLLFLMQASLGSLRLQQQGTE